MKKLIRQYSLLMLPVLFNCLGYSALAAEEVFPTEECKKFVTETMPKFGWKGASVDVPLDWKKPNERKIKVFFYFDGSRDLKTSMPILLFNGGPSMTYHVDIERMNNRYQEYDKNKKHVFVMMDQRGVGCSTQNPMPNQKLEEFTLFGSDQIVQDAEAIRKSFFKVKKWKVFGQSYGGVLTKRYVTTYPQAVQSAHVFDSAWQDSMSDFFMNRILKQTKVVPRFLSYHKNDPELLAAIRMMMDPVQGKNICIKVNNDTQTLCGKILLNGVLSAVGNGMGFAPGLHDKWDPLAVTIKSVLKEETRSKFLDAAKSGLAYFTNGDNITKTASIWSRDHYLINGNYDFDCNVAQETLRNKYHIRPEGLLLNECVIIQNAIPLATKKMLQGKIVSSTDQITPARLQDALIKNPQIKFYLYSAELGTSTLEESIKPYTSLPQIKYQSVLGLGHNGWYFHPDLWQKLME